jgi:hypothetical protein
MSTKDTPCQHCNKSFTKKGLNIHLKHCKFIIPEIIAEVIPEIIDEIIPEITVEGIPEIIDEVIPETFIEDTYEDGKYMHLCLECGNQSQLPFIAETLFCISCSTPMKYDLSVDLALEHYQRESVKACIQVCGKRK